MRDFAYPFLTARLFNTPLLADPRKATVVAKALAPRLGLGRVEVVAEGSAPAELAADARFRETRPVRRSGPIDEAVLRARSDSPFIFDEPSGIAYIPVSGTLVHKAGYIGSSSGEMGYDGIGAQLDAALADPRVRGILMDHHSPGGEVSGAFQLADRIMDARAVKPIIAHVDEMALSASYALASAAHEVWLASETAEVGSVGVIALHADFSRALDAAGITVTLITAGEHKADGNPFEPLPRDVLKRLQAEVDFLRDRFVARVARFRGLTEARVRATEALTYLGPSAVDAGLVDGIASPRAIYDNFAAQLRQPQTAVLAASN